MRASHIALIAAVLAIPSVGYAQQDNGPVGGMVGPEGSSSPGPSLGQPRPSAAVATDVNELLVQARRFRPRQYYCERRRRLLGLAG